MKAKILGVVLMAFLMVGCNTSSNTSNGNPPPPNPGENDITELGYDPAQRWPDQGEFTYNHRYTYNGVTCETGKQTFGNRAEYCMALQNQKLNNNCALPSRKGNYKSECGDDFQELNFAGEFSKRGYDNYLQQNCSTANATSLFRNLKHYCDFIKDESLHKNCFWNDRYKHFKSKECKGDFSVMPPQSEEQINPQPNPQDPNPNPNPNPPPMPDPIQEIPIVKELKEHGIITTVDWDAIRAVSNRPPPGDLPVSEKMKIVWAELTANKAEIVKRKSIINHIDISIYTDYRIYNEDKQLTIDFETQPKQLKEYFPLFDKIVVYTNELQIDFDFIHTGSKSDKIFYKPLREVLSAIEKYFAELKSGTGLFKEIRVDSYSYYYSGGQRLTLDREKIESDFGVYIKLLKPLSPTMNWLRKNNVELDTDFKIEQESRQVYDAFKILEASIPHLDKMLKASMFTSLRLYYTDDDSRYYSSLKKLVLSITNTNQAKVVDYLTKLGKIAVMQTEASVVIEISSDELDENFLKSSAQLEKFWPKIKAKISKIKQISLGYESTYYEGLKKLIIGYNSAEAETDKVIKDIK